MQRFSTWRIIGCLVVMLLLAGCPQTNEPAPLPPTRTPMPTFTATPEGPVVDVAATEAALAAAATNAAVEPPTAAPTEAPAEAPTAAEPTATPTPDAAVATVSQAINVRGGPGTNYQIIGAAQPGTQFTILGKDPTGAWWQVNYNGQNGWLFGQLVNAQNTGAVPVAQNIPAPPPPTATPIPQPTQPPAQPTQAPPAQQPTAAPPPAANYKFNVVVVGKCERQPAGNWFEGRTYIGGQPANGYKVVFSYAPDAAPITAPVISGPHPGYPGWNTGYYSHIINATGPKPGTWYVWIVDDSGNRISEIGNWTSTGPGEGCNQAVVDFDSR
ncbi:MAG: SH3 domain-containing protein [Caldilineaceae bacterium]|nr:SH3 domain-containing protein [Caldilineaceae bacterium]